MQHGSHGTHAESQSSDHCVLLTSLVISMDFGHVLLSFMPLIELMMGDVSAFTVAHRARA